MLNVLISIALATKCPAIADGMRITATSEQVKVAAGHIYINDNLVAVPEQTMKTVLCPTPKGIVESVDRLVVNSEGRVRCECYSPLKHASKDEVTFATITQVPPTTNAPILRPVIQEAAPAETAKEMKDNAAALPKTAAILRDGGTLRMVFWGDSITAGTGASTQDKRFASMTVKLLRESFPNVQFESRAVGIPATNTTGRWPTAEHDVFEDNPNLVVVEFLNDFALKEEDLARNYERIEALARKHGSELLFVRVSSPLPSVYQLRHRSDFETLPAHRLWMQRNAEHKIGLAQVEKAFEAAPEEGVERKELMADELHPNDWGHAFYARTINATLHEIVHP